MYKVIDLFAGVGGLSLGFKNAGFDIVYANEFDKHIALSYKKNFDNFEVDTRDINSINIKSDLKKFKNNIDVVMGGPPCQGFSQKGKRQGLKDKRNFLFRKYLDIVKFINPKIFLIENVPGIVTSNNAYFINEIKEFLSSTGYSFNSSILNSYDYGIPQIRKRAFIIGIKSNNKYIFPEHDDKKVCVKEAISDLPKLLSGEGQEFVEYNSKPKSNYQKMCREGSKGFWNHISTNHSKSALEKLSYIPENGTKDDLPDHLKTKSIHSGTWARINQNGPAKTITTRFDTPSSGEFTLNKQDRCLTVREAARIQSFPDKIVFYGPKTSQMKQVGNAVPPLLSKKIAQSLIKFL